METQVEQDPESFRKGKTGVEDWSPLNPAVRALLDHLAEELAAEFIRLTRAASGEVKSTSPGNEETR